MSQVMPPQAPSGADFGVIKETAKMNGVEMERYARKPGKLSVRTWILILLAAAVMAAAVIIWLFAGSSSAVSKRGVKAILQGNTAKAEKSLIFSLDEVPGSGADAWQQEAAQFLQESVGEVKDIRISVSSRQTDGTFRLENMAKPEYADLLPAKTARGEILTLNVHLQGEKEVKDLQVTVTLCKIGGSWKIVDMVSDDVDLMPYHILKGN